MSTGEVQWFLHCVSLDCTQFHYSIGILKLMLQRSSFQVLNFSSGNFIPIYWNGGQSKRNTLYSSAVDLYACKIRAAFPSIRWEGSTIPWAIYYIILKDRKIKLTFLPLIFALYYTCFRCQNVGNLVGYWGNISKIPKFSYMTE